MEFKDNWNIWYHHEKDNWTLDGYKNIYTIKDPESFWKLYNNWDSIGGIISKHFFIMKNDIKPIWEDKKNKLGGCWSFKVMEHQAVELWEELSVLLVTNELLKNTDNECVGLSICLKKNNSCVIKIWNTDSKVNSIQNINPKILEKWGTDIIYIAHMPDKLIV